jgi:transcriptional regulator with XRE-family HTH domain
VAQIEYEIAFMQVNDRIDAIAERAARMNLSLARLCRLAGTDYSQVWRWRQGRCRPFVHTAERATRLLETKLVELEHGLSERKAS